MDSFRLDAAIIQRLKQMYDEVTGKGAAHYYTNFWMRGQALCLSRTPSTRTQGCRPSDFSRSRGQDSPASTKPRDSS